MRSGFFNSNISGYDDYGNPIYDRAEEASFFAAFFAAFIGTGVYPNPSTGMQVVENSTRGVLVKPGKCFINGYFGLVESAGEEVVFDTADTSLSRIDRVVARWDLQKRDINLHVLKGTPDVNPVAPSLTRNSNIFELGLADVKIGKNVSIITQANITDTRLDNNLCGIVTGVIEQVDTTTLFNQYLAWFNEMKQQSSDDYQEWFDGFTGPSEAQFNEWFNGIKNQLSEDQAGHLQNEIDGIQKDLNNIKSIAIASNAGAHNAIYRGKDITDLFYNGTLSQQIAAGTFDDIFIGDYIIGKSSKRKYLVADINYRLGTGMEELTTNHVLMIPEKIMGSNKMNDTNIITGAYAGSKMYTTYLTPHKTTIQNDFGSNHLLTHPIVLASGVTGEVETEIKWYDNMVDLMNEFMVYGGNVLHNCRNGAIVPTGNITTDNSQLALFRLAKNKIIAKNNSDERVGYWLRDVTTSIGFAIVDGNGRAYQASASDLKGIRPAFLIY